MSLNIHVGPTYLDYIQIVYSVTTAARIPYWFHVKMVFCQNGLHFFGQNGLLQKWSPFKIMVLKILIESVEN